jgi:hypothetical protein
MNTENYHVQISRRAGGIALSYSPPQERQRHTGAWEEPVGAAEGRKISQKNSKTAGGFRP